MEDKIIDIALLGTTRTGQEINVSIQIGRPVQLSGQSAECPIFLVGLETKPTKIYGVDTLQALCLALRHSRFLIGEFIKYGGKLCYQDDEDRQELSLDLLFPTPLSIPSQMS